MKKLFLFAGLLCLTQVVEAQTNSKGKETSAPASHQKDTKRVSQMPNSPTYQKMVSKEEKDAARTKNPNYDTTVVAGPNPRKRNPSKKSETTVK
jgi:hypothetical protein